MVMLDGLDLDDGERLNAAASLPADVRPEFDEVFANLENGSTREAALAAWNSYVAYWDSGDPNPIPAAD